MTAHFADEMRFTPRSHNQRIAVAIVGAGPTGLSLALGLARQGVRSVLFERKETTSEYSKAPGIHVRTREIFRQWGVEDRFVDAGVLRRKLTLHHPEPGKGPLVSFDFADLDEEAERPGLLILEQAETERLLLDAVQETGMCDVRFGTEVVGLTQSEDGAQLSFQNNAARGSLEAEFVVGCDGASSFVRNALELPFEGLTYSTRPILADVRIDDDRDALAWPRVWNGRDGVTSAMRLRPKLWRIVRLEAGEPAQGEEVARAELKARVAEVLGEGPFDVVWASRFRIHLRSSPTFRVGRVLLAGDAAHVHSPAGGQGMNGGVQDAHGLAWKLAHALNGGDVERLLDAYNKERRAVIVEGVSRFADINTRVFLQAPALVRTTAFALLRGLLRVPRLRMRMLRRTAMLDHQYPSSPVLDLREHAAGVRLPNPLLRSSDGASVRLYDLLPYGPALLVLGNQPNVPTDLPVKTVIRIGASGYHDPTGALAGLLRGQDGFVFVRPDTYVAWAREHLNEVEQGVERALGLPPERTAVA